MTTFTRGDRVVVESPVYMPETSGPHEFRDPAEVTVGSTGTIVRGEPDWDGDLLVDVDGYGTAYIATDGLLKVDDLGTLAAERSPAPAFKVGDRVIVANPAAWRMSSGSTAREGLEGDAPHTGTVVGFGLFSPDNVSVALDDDPTYDDEMPLAALPESLTLVDPEPTPDPVRIDVRFYIGDVDVTAHIASALKEAA